MALHSPNRREYFRQQGIALFCLLVPIFVHANVAAQDVAEAARQQRAHKSQYPVAPHHVYTEDDLKRPCILIPEDQNRVEARREASPAPAPANLSPLDAETNAPSLSLGEIARRHRKEKAAREVEAALNERPSSFPLELPGTAFAEPKGSVPLSRAPRTVAPPVVVTTSPVPFERSAANARVSPFQPRPWIAPTTVSPLTRANTPARAATRNFIRIQVHSGESFWKLARRYLGSGSRWQELASLNPGVADHADFLSRGSTILVPNNGGSRASRASVPETLTVHRGDTLWSLSRVHLGHGSDWRRLARANPQLSDYLHLLVGSQLHLPH
jgi:nucleoid-associated protein YgaU